HPRPTLFPYTTLFRSQLIRGGRQPSLQKANLLAALRSQKASGVIDDEIAEHLKDAYLFLRRVEHMLQYREDEQTHLLPRETRLKDRKSTRLNSSHVKI